MEANQKAWTDNDKAASPVIATILLVAMSLVLGASIYSWVSSFGADGQAPDKNIGLVSNEPYDDDLFVKEYAVATGVGMRYGDVGVTLDGVPLALAAAAADDRWYVLRGGGVLASPATESVRAGDLLVLNDDADMSGKTLRILDREANLILVTVTVK